MHGRIVTPVSGLTTPSYRNQMTTEMFKKLFYAMTHQFSSLFHEDGTQFSPRVSKDDVLYGFSPEICR